MADQIIEIQKLKSLFGEFNPPKDFKPLIALGECEDESMDPIIEGGPFSNTYCLLHGLKETLKSWFSAYFAVCTASGHPFFGKKVLKPGGVVYVYGEGRMVWRLKAICRGLGISFPKDLYPFRLRADLSNKKEIDTFLKLIPEDVVLIIIDNFEKFWDSEMDEKIVTACTRLMRLLANVTTPFLIQHQPKNVSATGTGHKRAKGSGRLANAADSTIELNRAKNGTIWATFYHRDAERPQSINFRLRKLAEDSFRLEPLEGGKQYDEGSGEEPSEKTYRQILTRLKVSMKGEALSKSSIYEVRLKGHGIKGLSSKAYFDYFHDRLIEDGWIRETDEKGKFEFNDRQLLGTSEK